MISDKYRNMLIEASKIEHTKKRGDSTIRNEAIYDVTETIKLNQPECFRQEALIKNEKF